MWFIGHRAIGDPLEPGYLSALSGVEVRCVRSEVTAVSGPCALWADADPTIVIHNKTTYCGGI